MREKEDKSSIAILDSGVSDSLRNKIEIAGEKNFTGRDDCCEDDNGHGSSCVSVIERINPNVKYYILKVLDKNARTSGDVLIRALQYLQDIEADYICMSLSTPNTKYAAEMMPLCKQLKEQGKIILASRSNACQEESYPALLPDVIGVEGILMDNEEDFWYDADSRLQVVGDLSPVFVPDIGSKRWNLFGGNSKATAAIAGIITKNCKDTSFLESHAKRKSWNENDILEGKKNRNEKSLALWKPNPLEQDIAAMLTSYIPEYSPGMGIHGHLRPGDYFDMTENLTDKFGILIDYSTIRYHNFNNSYTLAEYIKTRMPENTLFLGNP